jgi:hypothetical protein
VRLFRTGLLSKVRRDRHSGLGRPIQFRSVGLGRREHAGSGTVSGACVGPCPSFDPSLHALRPPPVGRCCSRLHRCRVGRGGAYALPPPARSNGSCSFCFAAPSVSRKPLSCVVVSMNGGGIAPLPSVSCRGPGFLDVGAGSFALRTYPHFRHVLTRSSTLDAATQHGAFPLRPAFWARPASSLAGDDPEPFVPTPFQSTVPRSDSWHRIGRNFARAYIRTYRRVAPGRALRSPLLALSSASVALFQPYLPVGRYQVSLSH